MLIKKNKKMEKVLGKQKCKKTP